MSSINILILAFLSGLATFFGVYLGDKSNKSTANIAFGTSFAAGIMILISFFELIPEAYHSAGARSLFWVVLGLLAVWLINKILPHIHSIKGIENCEQKCSLKLSYLLAIGLILHDFPEGFAIPSSFTSSSELGLLLVIATFIHNIPEGYVLTVASAKYKSKGFFYKLALFSAVSTLLGATLGVILIHYFSFLNPVFLSIAAGAMIFISIHELIPASLKNGRKLTFLLGTSTSLAVYFGLNLIF
ncbi:MAG: ZIP family metal transporter [Patescibacteria group bacterium]